MNSDRSTKSSFFRYTIPVIIIFSFIYLFIYLVQGTPIVDDAYIFFRYADNWGNGYGPVFNVNEYTEGFSSELWTAILAAGAFFSFDLETFAPVVNLIFGISCVILLNYICSFIPFRNAGLMTLICSMLYIASYGVYIYAVSGMENPLFSTLLMLVVIGIYKGRVSGNYLVVFPLICLLNLSRPEAFLYSFVMMAVLTFTIYLDEREIPKKLIYLWVLVVCFTAAHFITRYYIYNDLVPLTVHAKSFAKYSLLKFLSEGDMRSLKNFIYVILSGFKYEAPILFLGVWIPFIVLVKNKKTEDLLLWLMALCISVNVFISIMAGGDFFLFKRHMTPVLPFMIITVVWAIELLLNRYKDFLDNRKAGVTAALVVLLFLWVGLFLKPVEISKKHGIKPHFSYLKDLGILMKELPGSTVLLTDRAGIMPYFAGINVYVRDLFGLMDAHNAKHGDTFCTSSETGVCGRTDYVYSFSTPFDIFVYNANSINRRFVLFCEKNPDICSNYRFLKKEEWKNEKLYVIADNRHPVFGSLQKKFGAVPIPVDRDMIR